MSAPKPAHVSPQYSTLHKSFRVTVIKAISTIQHEDRPTLNHTLSYLRLGPVHKRLLNLQKSEHILVSTYGCEHATTNSIFTVTITEI